MLKPDDEQMEPAMIRTPRGRGRGKSIELDEDFGVTEGREGQIAS